MADSVTAEAVMHSSNTAGEERSVSHTGGRERLISSETARQVAQSAAAEEHAVSEAKEDSKTQDDVPSPQGKGRDFVELPRRATVLFEFTALRSLGNRGIQV